MSDSHTQGSSLTKMEKRVGRLISLGFTVRQSAAVLGRSESTIDNHKTKVMKKLGVHNMAALTRRMIRDGVSPLDDAPTAEEAAHLKESQGIEEERPRPRMPIPTDIGHATIPPLPTSAHV